MTTQTVATPSCIPRELQLKASMFSLARVNGQIEAGYNVLRKYHRTATIFGSARLKEDNDYYQKARELGQKLAEADFAVVTGGGGGIMEAANRGAFEAGGDSIGFNIILPHEQILNEYTTDSYTFAHFAPRKIVMTLSASAYIYFPGGYGSLDELLEILTLIQTRKTQPVPVILYGSQFWNGINNFFINSLDYEFGTISRGDDKLYMITDDLTDVMTVVENSHTYCGH